MAQCALWQSAVLDGTSVNVLVASDAAHCTGAVVLTPSEYSALSNNPLNLSLEDGALISGAIAGVWALAWCFKQVAKTINLDGDSSQE